MSNFEERLNWLEVKVNSHDALLTSGISDALPPGNRPLTSSDQGAIDVQQSSTIDGFMLQEEPREDVLTDGMAITFVSEDDSGFFGL